MFNELNIDVPSLENPSSCTSHICHPAYFFSAYLQFVCVYACVLAGPQQQQPAVPEVSEPGGRRPVCVQGHRASDRRGRDRGHAHSQRSVAHNLPRRFFQAENVNSVELVIMGSRAPRLLLLLLKDEEQIHTGCFHLFDGLITTIMSAKWAAEAGRTIVFMSGWRDESRPTLRPFIAGGASRDN